MISLLLSLLLLLGGEGMQAGEVSYDDEQLEFLENLTFTDFDGQQHDLSMFDGQVVLIDVWETWCTPCLMSFPHLDQLQQDFGDDFAVLALSPLMMDDKDTVTEFIGEHDYDFFYAYNEEIAEVLQINSIPYKIYIGPDGEFVEAKIGNQGPDADYENTREIIEEYGR